MNEAWSCLSRQSYQYSDYVIVPIRHVDIEPIRTWRNAQLSVLRQAAPISPAQQESYFAQHIWPTMHLKQPSNILMSFLYRGRLIGYGGLVHISWLDHRAEMSFLVDDLRAQDLDLYTSDFSAFIQLIKSMAFDDLGFRRVLTETYANRSFHIGILEQCGFEREGVLRDHVKIEGFFVDSIIHGLLKG